jgi:hypothetical protein
VVTCDELTYVIVVSTGKVIGKISSLDHKNLNHLSLIHLQIFCEISNIILAILRTALTLVYKNFSLMQKELIRNPTIKQTLYRVNKHYQYLSYNTVMERLIKTKTFLFLG